jgi:DNA-binding protein HU-beta
VNQRQLVEAIASRLNVSPRHVEGVISTALDVIVQSVAGGERVSITNFGTWYPAERPEHKRRNPQTGGTVTVQAGRTPRFRVGPRFKQIVFGGDPTARRRKLAPHRARSDTEE